MYTKMNWLCVSDIKKPGCGTRLDLYRRVAAVGSKACKLAHEYERQLNGNREWQDAVKAGASEIFSVCAEPWSIIRDRRDIQDFDAIPMLEKAAH